MRTNQHGSGYNSIKKGLPFHHIPVYGYNAPAKSGVGLGGLEYTRAHSRASGFFVCNAQVHPNYGGLSGGAYGLAGCSSDRSANSAQVTTSMLGGIGGENLLLTREAAAMATIPTQHLPKFQYHFLSVLGVDHA